MDPFVGEIRLFGGAYVPENWALCDGSSLSVEQNATLHHLINETYGTTGPGFFNLPNLVDRIAIGRGQGSGLSMRNLGDSGGSPRTTLSVANLPPHHHDMLYIVQAPTQESPQNHRLSWSPDGYVSYCPPENNPTMTTLSSRAIASSGSPSPAPVPNGMPTLAMPFIISLHGFLPAA